MSRPAKVTERDSGRSRLPRQRGAVAAEEVLRHPIADQRALRGGEGVQHITPRARERALVIGSLLAREGAPHLSRIVPRIDRDDRLLVGEEEPVAILLGEFPPRAIDIVAERLQDVAQVLTLPGGRPGGNGPFANGQGVVQYHRAFRHLVYPAQPVTGGTGPFRGVRRKRLRVEVRLAGRVRPGAGIQHAEQVRERRYAADGRAGGRRAALLLEGDRRGQAVDGIDLGNAHLIEQASGVRDDRLEVAPLRLAVERAEGQRRFARARHAREDDQRITRDVEIDVLEVVFARPAHADEPLQQWVWRSRRVR
jgi:hypothetical protein